MTLAHLAMVRAATDAEARGTGAARTKAGMKMKYRTAKGPELSFLGETQMTQIQTQYHYDYSNPFDYPPQGETYFVTFRIMDKEGFEDFFGSGVFSLLSDCLFYGHDKGKSLSRRKNRVYVRFSKITTEGPFSKTENASKPIYFFDGEVLDINNV